MADLALWLCGGYWLLALGLRAAVHRRRTGSWGIRTIAQSGSVAARWAGLLLAGGVVGLVLGIVAVHQGWLTPIAALQESRVAATGILLYGLGLIATIAAQSDMGASWRVGVDRHEATALVTRGLFRHARNPIYSAMIATGAGLTLLAPHAFTIVALALLALGIEIQVRAVEEPHLRRTHGTAYLEYARRAGRFLPGIGQLRP